PPGVAPGLCRDLRPFQSFGPQYVEDVEFGVKSDWNFANASLRLNLAIYQADNKDLQQLRFVTALVDPADPGYPRYGAVYFNVGAVEREGIEASAVLMVGERLTFNANGTYVRGEETKAENPPIPGLPPPTTSEIDSRHTYALGMNYVHPVAGSTVEFSADYSFRSKIDQQVIHY